MSFKAVQKATLYLVKRLHLRPVKNVKLTFDPYMNASTSVRDVASVLHRPEILETNQATQIRFDVRSDRTEPQMHVEFNDGHKLLFKTANLSKIEILDYLFEYVDEKDPKKYEAPELVTKSGRQGKKR